MDKLKIFITWSGPRSGAVAKVLKEYLPMINNAFDPWLSSKDIPKGSRSTAEIAEALANARAGIICLTPNNLTEPWILFEAGAVSKTVKEKPLACTLLIDLQPSDVPPPLGDFQHTTKLNEEELLALAQTLNEALGEAALPDGQIKKMFDLCWPQLKGTFDKLPDDGPVERPHREQRDLLEEILDTVRTGTKNSAMLVQMADAITDIETRLVALTPSFTVPYSVSGSRIHVDSGSSGTGLGGIRLPPIRSNPFEAVHAFSTVGNEPPPVPPELLETGSNQPTSGAQPAAPRRKKKFAHASRRGPKTPT
jgi:hypothetical protein